MSLELHKQAILDAPDVEFSKMVSAVIVELRRRALLSKSYHPLASTIAHNVMRNASLAAIGEKHDGVSIPQGAK